MPDTGSLHAPEDRLEAYAMGKLCEEELVPFEEHLLVCPQCQDKLQEIDSFLAHFRPVAARLREEDAQRPLTDSSLNKIRRVLGNWTAAPLPVRAALALAVVAGAIFLVPRPFQRPAGYKAVALQAVRGAETAGVALVNADQVPQLEIDLTQLPAQASWTVEVVDFTGGKVLEATVETQGSRLSVRLEKPLPGGMYFVRLYGAGRAELLREFGLESR